MSKFTVFTLPGGYYRGMLAEGTRGYMVFDGTATHEYALRRPYDGGEPILMRRFADCDVTIDELYGFEVPWFAASLWFGDRGLHDFEAERDRGLEQVAPIRER